MKTMYQALICAFLCLSGITVQAQQNIKEGRISYTAEYDLPPDQQMAAAMLPKEYTIYFKGDKSKFTLDMGMMTNTVITDSKSMEGLMLIDVPMAGQKMAVKTDKADKEKQLKAMENLDISKTSETKTIAGYKATKYTVKDKESGSDSEIWATTELITPVNEFTQSMKIIEGTLLAFSTKMNGISIKMNFKDVKEEPVADISMAVPEGYTVKTMEELQSMSGQ